MAMDLHSYMELARRAAESGKGDEVISACQAVLDVDAQHAEANFLMGSALLEKSRYGEALPYFDYAWRSSQEVPFELMYNSGFCLLRERRFVEALPVFKKANVLRPESVEVAECLLQVYVELEQAEPGMEIAKSLLEYNPENPGYWLMYSRLNNLCRRWLDAAKAALKVAELPGRSVLGDIQLVHVLAHADVYRPAERLAVALPDHERESWSARGTLRLKQGHYAEAITLYQQALLLPPAKIDAEASSTSNILYNQALACLVQGDYIHGWDLYRRRFDVRYQSSATQMTELPLWQGEADHNAVVWVHSEQGLGDVIQCLRYLPRMRTLTKQVVWGCYPLLVELLRHDEDAIELESIEVEPTHQISMFDLPRYLESPDGQILPMPPYLNAPAAQLAEWHEKLQSFSGFKVGLIWAGNPQHQNDHNRSMALKDFAPLVGVPSVNFFGLQVGEFSAQASSPPTGMTLHDLSGDIHDFGDTAAILGNLDLLITIDSSVAHLAGAMGRPVWMLLPHRCDWRWVVGRDDTAWYPSLRIFRQAEGELWSDVMERVCLALANTVLQQNVSSSKIEQSVLTYLSHGPSADGISAWLSLWMQYPGSDAVFNLLFTMPASQRDQCLQNSQVEGVSAWQKLLIAEARQNLVAVQSAWDTGQWQPFSSRWQELIIYVRFLCRNNQFAELGPLLEKGLQQFVGNSDLLYWRAQAFRQQGDFESAVKDYSAVLDVSHRAPEARVNLAVCLRSLGDLKQALHHLQLAVLYNPKHLPSWDHLLRYLDEAKDWVAIPWVAEQMLTWAPRHVRAWYLWGVAEQLLGNWQLAAHCLEHAIKLDPDHLEARIWLARVHFSLGRHHEALDELLELSDTANVRLARGFNCMSLGKYAEGWALLESRLEFSSAQSIKRLYPALERLTAFPENKPVFVMADQGAGDSIMMARYLACLPAGSLIQVQNGLENLIGRAFPQHKVVSQSDMQNISDIPSQGVEFMSLPYLLDGHVDDAELTAPYLFADPARCDMIRKNFAPLRQHQLSIGLVWAGNSSHFNDRLRSIPLRKLKAAIQSISADWVSLQKGESAYVLQSSEENLLIDTSDWINDWSDTAALINELDVIVSVDTAVVHLAGAMGKRAILLLHEPAEWRWGLTAGVTPWYPSLQLIRQQHTGDWGEVITRLVDELNHITSESETC